MRSFKYSIWDLYDEITSDKEKWTYYSDMEVDSTAQDLFDNKNALSFIKSAFKKGSKDKALDIIYRNEFEISQYRSNHTLSAYLLGITLRDKLCIDMRELPKVDEIPTKNFLYFWSLTCLYHDFAFSVEEKSKELISKISNMDDLIKCFEIKYSMLEESEIKDLINNYFIYRLKERNTIDHGIVGAMLLYSGLMEQYAEAIKEENITSKISFIHNGLKYSREYKKQILFIANTIAQHNMWRADEKTINLYKKYHLEPLIPNNNNSHMIRINQSNEGQKNKLLFLLCLVDTIEPIKCLGREKNKSKVSNPYIILEKLRISFNKAEKRISIYCPERYYLDYTNCLSGIDKWLDVKFISEDKDNTFSISINL